MKKQLQLLIAALIISLSSVAQAPQGISHQALVRDNQNEPVVNSPIGVRVSILQGSAEGTEVYTETHTVQSNANGLITYIIGQGDVESGAFDEINWGEADHFLKNEFDLEGGTSYTLSGTTQIFSVPYALYAGEIKLQKNATPAELYIADDGTLMALPKISVEYPYSEEPTVTDIDDNYYNTVKIGTQIWMAENLRVTKYNNGDEILTGLSNEEWGNLDEVGAYAVYPYTEIDGLNSEEEVLDSYGALYNGYAVDDARGLCPTGWRVPNDDDWTVLSNYLGSLIGGRMKGTGTIYWIAPNIDAINDSKFTALPGGCRHINHGGFGNAGYSGYWWIAREFGVNNASSRRIDRDGSYVISTGNDKIYGFSVRCLSEID